MKLVEHGSVIIEDIEVGDRLRAIDQDWVEGLAETIKISGLQNPIELVKIGNTLRLVSGAHRLAAFKHLKLASIPARIVEPETDYPELEIRMDEIVENIARRDLSPMDRAAHVAELKIAFKTLHGETRGRPTKDNKGDNRPYYSLKDSISKKMGLSESMVKQDIRLHVNLSAASKARLVGTKIANNRANLLALAEETPQDQKAILNILLSVPPKASNMQNAKALHHNKVDLTTPDEKTFASFVKLWGKASGKARKQMLIYIEAQGLK